VGKHYKSGNMQRLQKQWTGQSVVWFTIISSAPGKQGYVTASEENEYLTKMQAAPTAALLDPTGQIGHLYDAKTSPQMVVINPQGIVIYDGAIDDRPTTDLSDISEATNYLNLALKQAMAGKQVETPATRPYGCSVKVFGLVALALPNSVAVSRSSSRHVFLIQSFRLSTPFPSPLATCCRSFREGRRVHGPRH